MFSFKMPLGGSWRGNHLLHTAPALGQSGRYSLLSRYVVSILCFPPRLDGGPTMLPCAGEANSVNKGN